MWKIKLNGGVYATFQCHIRAFVEFKDLIKMLLNEGSSFADVVMESPQGEVEYSFQKNVV